MAVDKITYAVEPQGAVLIPVDNSEALFPVHRIYCVGKNYDDHVKEMGSDPERSSPVFFMKPADAVVVAPKGGDCKIPYPPETNNLHHEIELVVAIGRGGENIPKDEASDVIFGYGVGVDLTRRDLQAEAKKNGGPWDIAKGFDCSAPISPIIENKQILKSGGIWLSVNGDMRQNGDLQDMIWGVSEVIATLSRYYKLEAGDLIFMGTPSGVGPLSVGDHVEGGIDNVGGLNFTVS